MLCSATKGFKTSHRLLFSFSKKKDGFQIIDYSELEFGQADLHEKLGRAFGRDGIGAILIRNIPDLPEKRQVLLPQEVKLSSLPNSALRALERPESHFQRGWSERNQQIYGRADRSLGIFRARISSEDKYTLRQSQVEALPRRILNTLCDNVWPSQAYKKAFLDYHSLVQRVGLILVSRLEKYIEQKEPFVRTNTLSQLLKRSDQHVGSNFFSYPTVSHEQLSSDWDYWHSDYSILQGLSSTVYLDREGQAVDYLDQDAGLHIFAQSPDQYIKIRLDDRSILFKAGEVLQILSGGTVYPKPHRLIRGNFLEGKSLAIQYLSTSINPNLEEKLNIPPGIKVEQIINQSFDQYLPAALSERWYPGETYGQFVEKTFAVYASKKK